MMRRSFKILLAMAALGLATVGIMSVAGADEALANGDYALTVPGVGDIAFTVTDGTVNVTTAPDGFSGLAVATSDEGEFVLTSTTDPALSIQVEADDGAFVGEFKIDLGPATPGMRSVTIGTYGLFDVTVADDGSLSMVEPAGFTLETTDDGLKLTAADGTIIEIKAEDGVLQASVSSPEADESSDEEIPNDEQDSDEVSADASDSDEVSANDESSDEISDDKSSDVSDSESDETDGSDAADGPAETESGK